MDLFYKIHLEAFNVISTVLYHSDPTFGKDLYACLNAFVVDVSDYSGHLIRHLIRSHPDPSRRLSTNLYDIYHCCVYSEEVLMMDRVTVRNM
jgi:hypothetical protein